MLRTYCKIPRKNRRKNWPTSVINFPQIAASTLMPLTATAPALLALLDLASGRHSASFS